MRRSRALDREPVVLRRDQAFIGVLVDDLVTSRGRRAVPAVHVAFRVSAAASPGQRTPAAAAACRAVGPLDRCRLAGAEQHLRSEDAVLELAERTSIEASAANPVLAGSGSPPIAERTEIAELARRPGVSVAALLGAAGQTVAEDAVEWADIEPEYAGYLRRERSAAGRLAHMEDFALPIELQYRSLRTLSLEAREKLQNRQAGLTWPSGADSRGLAQRAAESRHGGSQDARRLDVSRETTACSRDSNAACCTVSRETTRLLSLGLLLPYIVRGAATQPPPRRRDPEYKWS